MKFIVKLFPEITIKTRPVRKLFVKQLSQNIRNTLFRVTDQIKVRPGWDLIEVWTPESCDAAINDEVREALACIPGISHINQVWEHEFNGFDTAADLLVNMWQEKLAGASFVVRVKRSGKHEFTSVELERFLGGHLLKRTAAVRVDLNHADIEVNVEVKGQRLFLIDQRISGMGGYPLGSIDSTMTLVSGGFDSTVAAYQMIRRGVKTHFVFFRLGGIAHENGVKEIIYYLWNKYAASHTVQFVTIPFESVVESILETVEDRYMGVILKRMMMRAANQIADQLKLHSFVTGEAVSQVSSQTMSNQRLIDDACDRLVFRPLAVMDKQMIVDAAKTIGAAGFIERIPEYCGVISRKPNASCKKADVEREEAKLDARLIDRVVADATFESIKEMHWQSPMTMSLQNASDDAGTERVLVDVRHPAEAESNPLRHAEFQVIHIPFYSLNRKFSALDQNKIYLLYCDKGVMSKMHALHLNDMGFNNVQVFD